MTYYADLSPCDYFGSDVTLTAVGWLEADHPYTKGPVSDEFRTALANFIPFSRCFFLGFHECSLCHGFHGGVGGFVPSGDRLFAFPDLLDHYVEIHQYQPPAEFQEALQRCSPTTSDDYFNELGRLGMVVPEDERMAFRQLVNKSRPGNLLRRLENSDHDSEEHLLEILHQLGEFEHEPAVSQLTRVWHEHPQISARQAAGQALLSIGTPAALDALVQRSGDPDPQTAVLAVVSIFVQGPQQAFDRLPPSAATLQSLRFQLWPKEFTRYLRQKLMLRNGATHWFNSDSRWLQLCQTLQDDDNLGVLARRVIADS